MDRCERLLRSAARLLLDVASAAGLVLTGFVVLSAVMRYFLGTPFAFTEELVGLLYITIIFLTLPFATADRHHITVTAVIELLSLQGNFLVRSIAALVMIAFTGWFAVITWNYAAFAFEIDAESEQSGITLGPWLAVLPLTLILVTAIAVVQFLGDVLRRRRS